MGAIATPAPRAPSTPVTLIKYIVAGTKTPSMYFELYRCRGAPQVNAVFTSSDLVNFLVPSKNKSNLTSLLLYNNSVLNTLKSKRLLLNFLYLQLCAGSLLCDYSRRESFFML